VPAGATAVMSEGDQTKTDVAGAEPKSTVAPAVKAEPEMVTGVPPAAGPASGLTQPIDGAP